MIETKGELKFKKVDDHTLEVCDDNGCKLWTLETLDHSMIQIAKERSDRLTELENIAKEVSEEDADKLKAPDERLLVLNEYADYYQKLINEAAELGIVRKTNKRDVASRDIKNTSKE